MTEQSGITNGKWLIETFDHLVEGFMVIDFNWRYLYVNDTVVKRGKYTKNELLGHTMMEKHPGIENSEMFKILQRCMRDRTSACLEDNFSCPDELKGCLELSIQPIPEGLFILSVDITKRKKVEQEKREYIKDLEKMMTMASHNVRKPITEILGISYLLDMPINSQKEIKQIVGYMKTSVVSLEIFTKEFTALIYKMGQKGKT